MAKLIWVRQRAFMKHAAVAGPGNREGGLGQFLTVLTAAEFIASRFGSHQRPHLGFILWILGASVGFGQGGAEGTTPVSPPEFSVPGGIHSKAFEVELRAPKGLERTVIRYTLDGAEPTQKSSVYTRALNVTNSIYLRARAFVPGRGFSAASSQTYTLLAEGFQHFDSTLPLIVINTFGQSISHRTKVPGSVQVIEPAEGAVSLTSKTAWQGRLEISQRGNTSRQFPTRSNGSMIKAAHGRFRWPACQKTRIGCCTRLTSTAPNCGTSWRMISAIALGGMRLGPVLWRCL